MEKETIGDIPVLLLAAGSSSRMGQPKQLLTINGKMLLQNAVEVALNAETGKTIVVLGSNEATLRNLLDKYNVHIVANPDWEKGMGSSIKVGIKYIQEYFPESKAVIISVCDQPHLSPAHLNKLTEIYFKDKKSIVASSYNSTLGVPILFDQSLFSDLNKISDSKGAKKIIQAHLNEVSKVAFPLGEIDLDTMEDYNNFIQ